MRLFRKSAVRISTRLFQLTLVLWLLSYIFYIGVYRVTAQRGERNLDPNLSKTIWDSQWVEASSGSIKVGHDVAKLSPVDYH
ncbi:hypothetical protein KW782_04160, partial [Candidatus Parcubacteria bacterium]|nr:hypothetical protein [Candidatus Parcubacteria bacterium]